MSQYTETNEFPVSIPIVSMILGEIKDHHRYLYEHFVDQDDVVLVLTDSTESNLYKSMGAAGCPVLYGYRTGMLPREHAINTFSLPSEALPRLAGHLPVIFVDASGRLHAAALGARRPKPS